MCFDKDLSIQTGNYIIVRVAVFKFFPIGHAAAVLRATPTTAPTLLGRDSKKSLTSVSIVFLCFSTINNLEEAAI